MEYYLYLESRDFLIGADEFMITRNTYAFYLCPNYNFEIDCTCVLRSVYT